jgi:hypothetical protein
MQLSKSTIVPAFGLIVLLFFLAMAYQQNSVFFEKLLHCSIILAILFIIKIGGQIKKTTVDESDFKNYKNS